MDGTLLCVPHIAVGGKSEDKAIAICSTVFSLTLKAQDERWLARYNEVMDFMEKNHRNPSKYRLEEKLMHNWVHQNRKLMNQGRLKEERVEAFRRLLELGEKLRRVNQFK